MELEKLQEVIASVLNVDTREVTPDTTFVEDLGADSLDIMQIIVGIENVYDIQFPIEETEHIITVGDAVDVIRRIMG
ncbi:MAG: acyl carrier protein [Lachnospiraceae bacterium]|jgi:acyl carrier protein